MNESRHIWMGRVTYECVMSHMDASCDIRTSHMNESVHVRMSHMPCDSFELCDMGFSHVTYHWHMTCHCYDVPLLWHANASRDNTCTQHGGAAVRHDVWTSHIIDKWAMSHPKSHIPSQSVTSPTNVRMSYATYAHVTDLPHTQTHDSPRTHTNKWLTSHTHKHMTDLADTQTHDWHRTLRRGSHVTHAWVKSHMDESRPIEMSHVTYAWVTWRITFM